MKKTILMAVCVITTSAFVSCSKLTGEAPVPVTANAISLALDTAKLIVGTSVQLVSAHYAAADLIWHSSDTSIVTISATGLIVAKKIGQSLVSVSNKSNSASATCVVLVSSSINTGNITNIAGLATDIGIGADGSIFVVGNTTVSGTGGFSISKLVGNTLVKLPDCAAIRVAVSPQGVPWVVNKSNLIYRYNGTTWDLMPGSATDIGIGADGSIFAIGTIPSSSATGGYNIIQWNGTGWDTLFDCSGIHIAVSPQGIPWVVNQGNIVYRKQTTGVLWDPIPGISGDDIGVGADGSVYVTGVDSGVASYEPPIYKYDANNNSWIVVPNTSGASISVSPIGVPWWIDKSDKIFKGN